MGGGQSCVVVAVGKILGVTKNKWSVAGVAGLFDAGSKSNKDVLMQANYSILVKGQVTSVSVDVEMMILGVHWACMSEKSKLAYQSW